MSVIVASYSTANPQDVKACMVIHRDNDSVIGSVDVQDLWQYSVAIYETHDGSKPYIRCKVNLAVLNHAYQLKPYLTNSANESRDTICLTVADVQSWSPKQICDTVAQRFVCYMLDREHQLMQTHLHAPPLMFHDQIGVMEIGGHLYLLSKAAAWPIAKEAIICMADDSAVKRAVRAALISENNHQPLHQREYEKLSKRLTNIVLGSIHNASQYSADVI